MSSPSSSDDLAIHLDLVGGIAGDMFVAAMVDALPQLEAPIRETLSAVRPSGAPLPEFHEGRNGGLRVRRFGVAPDAAYRAVEDSAPGKSYSELRRCLGAASLAPDVRDHALALLLLLASAEAKVHGVPVDDVHFHELADWDSLADVTAAGCIAARLAGARWTASSLPIGGGRVRTAHGALPVPAPATSALLEGYRWHDDGVEGERVTPTGAAILRHLVPAEACGGVPSGRLVGIGTGAGARTLRGLPNIVRALVFERGSAMSHAEGDMVATLEFDVDDMTGEEIALAADRLRALTGVIDVSMGNRIGKKGRPVVDFRVLARPDAATSVADACFGETSTLGLRVRDERRHVLRRQEVRLTDADVTVKVARRPGGARTGKAAHDDVEAQATLDARRRSGASAVERALEDDER